MKTRSLLTATAISGIVLFGLAVPASASPPGATGATGATIEVTGGALAISVPTATVDLGSRADTVGGGIVSGQLGQVQVTDARGAPAGSGWVASVISTAFTPPSGPAIPASDVTYSAGQITKVGTATDVADDPSGLAGVVPAVAATGITGDNSATWDPTISVTVAGGMAAGVYSATITHSVV